MEEVEAALGAIDRLSLVNFPVAVRLLSLL
jgi:hypothetical protein